MTNNLKQKGYMSANQLRTLLNIYSGIDIFAHGAEFVSTAQLQKLKEDGLIIENPEQVQPHGIDVEREYILTKKGRYYITSVLLMPLPETRYFIPKEVRNDI